MWATDNIALTNTLFYPLYYDIISLQITQVLHILLGFAKNQIIFWDIKIRNSIWITKGLDNHNQDSDNRGSTVTILII